MRRRWGWGLVLVLLAGLGTVRYLGGGDQLTGDGGDVTALVTVGQEFHTMVHLDTDHGEIELLRARPIGHTEDLEVGLTLVAPNGHNSLGGWQGSLPDPFEPLDLRGFRLRTGVGPDRHDPAIDVRLVAATEGIHQLTGVAVTYRAGLGRERTAVLPVRLCLSASSDWRTAPEGECPLPGDP